MKLRESFKGCGLEEDQKNRLGAALLPLLFQDAALAVFRGNGKNEEKNKGL